MTNQEPAAAPKAKVTYENYLKVQELLNLQQLLSSPGEHDETLFIIIHQTYELWFKQILHEVQLICEKLDEDRLMMVMHALKRINAIQKVLIHQIDILETMTPNDFARFRNHLNPASGFQSYQFRITEYKLGYKDANYLRFYEHAPELRKLLEKTLEEPTIYDHFLRFLARQGFDIPKAILARDVSRPYEAHQDVVAIMRTVYQNPEQHSAVYLALEAMMDLDENFILWRYRHMAMVQRIIGNVMGTGGSKGASYLATTLSKRFFPEIWMVRDHLAVY